MATRPTFRFNFAAYGDKFAFTLRTMANLIKGFACNGTIRETALQIAANIPEHDKYGEAQALFCFVRDRIKYRDDVNDVETLQWPTVTLELGAGDCDDQVVLLNALQESIGFQTRLVCMNELSGAPFSHVYSEVAVNGEWIGQDPINPVPFGAIPARAAERRAFQYDG